MQIKPLYRYAGGLFLGAFQMSGVTSIPLAITLAVSAVICVVWGAWGSLSEVSIIPIGARKNSHNSQQFDFRFKSIISVAICVSFLVGIIGLNGALWYRDKLDRVLENIIYTNASRLTDNHFKVNINTRPLMRFSDQNYVLLACEANSESKDPFDITDIAMSEPFDIRDGDVWIDVALHKSILNPDELYKAQSFTCFLAMVPNKMRGHPINSLRQIKDTGGRILQVIGQTVSRMRMS